MDFPSSRRVLEAANLETNHPKAYADAFALATAVAHDATPLTGDPDSYPGDTPELDVLHLGGAEVDPFQLGGRQVDLAPAGPGNA